MNFSKLDVLHPVNIGISLSLVGVPIGMYLNDIYPIVKWSPIIMTLSFVLLVNWKNLLQFNFNRKQTLAIVAVFNFLCLLYWWFSDGETSTVDFQLYIIAMCIGYGTISSKYNLKSLTKTVFILSSFCSILGTFYTYFDLVVGDQVYMLKKEDDYAIEPFTVSFGMLINFFSILSIYKDSKYKILLLAFALLDLYVILYSTKRTPLFVLIIGCLLFMYLNGKFRDIGQILKSAFVLFVVCAILYNIDLFHDKFENFIQNMYAGVLNLFGDTSVMDNTGSAIARAHSRQIAWNIIDQNFEIHNYIFGYGYMTRWLDNPLLQSFLDMGLIGTVFYFCIIVAYPIKVLRSKPFNPIVQFALLCSLYAIISIFNSGNPYQQVKYVPILLLCYAYNYNKVSEAN